MPRTLDARGLLCPLPTVLTRAEISAMSAEEELTVLATDPEAPLDVSAAASDAGRPARTKRRDGHWVIEIGARGES